MPEENTNVVSAENIENNAAQAAADTAVPKTYTQDDMDRVIEARLKRERSRVAKEYANYDQYKQIVSTLKENGVIKTDDASEAVNVIKQFYAKGDGESVGEPSVKETPKAAEVLPKDEKLALVEVLSEKWVKNHSDEELEDEFQSLKEKGKRRTDEDDVRFSVITKKLGEITVKKTNQKQLDEFKARYPKVSIDDLRADTDFAKFAKLSKAPLAETYETYLSVRGVKPAEKVGIGSVSGSGDKPETNLYSAEEITNMTPEERRKNSDLIRKSIKANILKSMKT